jgi:thioredoxin reductase (NADPH)
MTRSVVIIGTGPAGLTAALYAGRANLKPLVVEGIEKGGQLMLTTAVENYPGFRNGIMGPDLMEEMRLQAGHFGAEFIEGDVTAIDLSQRPFKVSVGKTVYESEALVLATGATAKWLDLGVDRQLSGRGVSTCATCDGFFFKGQDVAVVGGGDTAMEEAIYLAKLCSTVTVIHRRDSLRASKVMQDKAMSLPNVSFIWNTEVVDVKDASLGTVTGLVLKNVQTGEVSDLAVNGLFIAIGHIPNTKLVAGQLALDEAGYVKTHDGSRTSVRGVFAAGDVQDHVYRQAVTAAGSGCMAAIDAERFLSGVAHA